jgi:hypothetical protein
MTKSVCEKERKEEKEMPPLSRTTHSVISLGKTKRACMRIIESFAEK